MRDLREVDLTKIAKSPQLLYDGNKKDRAKECFMNQTELNPRLRDLLVRIRCRSKVLSLYGIPSDLPEDADGQ